MPIIRALFLLLLAICLSGCPATARDRDKEPTETIVVPVYYATDRKVLKNNDGKEVIGYDNLRDPALFPRLDYGVCYVPVDVPESHLSDLGSDAREKLALRLNWKRVSGDADSKCTFRRISTDEKDNAKVFFSDLMAYKGTGKVVYTHGYNTVFDTAVRSAAHIGIASRQPVILYSWPSHGGVLAPRHTSFLARTGCALCLTYAWDMNNVNWSSPHFESFLREATGRLGAASLTLVAHSMGNQLLFNGLMARVDSSPVKGKKSEFEDIYSEGSGNTSRLEQSLERMGLFPVSALRNLVSGEKEILFHMVKDLESYKGLSKINTVALVAPDLDLDTFEYSFPKFLANADKTYLFTNEGDKALALSEKLNNGKRLGKGLLPELEKLFPNFHTVDFEDVAKGREAHHLDWTIVMSIIRTGEPPAGYHLDRSSSDKDEIARIIKD